MIEMMTILSVVSFLLAGVFAMVSVVLWIRFDIPGIVGEQRGGPAKRKLRSQNKAGEGAVITARRERKNGGTTGGEVRQGYDSGPADLPRRQDRRGRKGGEAAEIESWGESKSVEAMEREPRRGGRGRKERAWTAQETERLDRGYLYGKETRGRSGSAEDVMIIHTDEKI